MEGDVIGTHEGIIKYTVGQRKGLGIQTSKPMFCIKHKCQYKLHNCWPKGGLLRQAKFNINDVNWLDDIAFEKLIGSPKKVLVKTRYQRTPVMADITPLPNKKALVTLSNEEEEYPLAKHVFFIAKKKHVCWEEDG